MFLTYQSYLVLRTILFSFQSSSEEFHREIFGTSSRPPSGGSVCRASSDVQTSHQERWSAKYTRPRFQVKGDGNNAYVPDVGSLGLSIEKLLDPLQFRPRSRKIHVSTRIYPFRRFSKQNGQSAFRLVSLCCRENSGIVFLHQCVPERSVVVIKIQFFPRDRFPPLVLGEAGKTLVHKIHSITSATDSQRLPFRQKAVSNATPRENHG